MMQNLYDEALRAHKAGQYADAIVIYRKILSQEPKNNRARNNLGVALSVLGKFNEAESELMKIYKENPDSIEIAQNLANIFLKTNRRFDAAATLGNLATRLGDKQRVDDAERLYHQALTIDPSLPELFNNLANLQRTVKKDDTKAVKNYQRAILLKPSYVSVYTRLGLTCSRAAKGTAANIDITALYRRAAELAPLDPGVAHDHAMHFRNTGKLEQAKALLRNNLRRHPNYLPTLIELGSLVKYDLDGSEFSAMKAQLSSIEEKSHIIKKRLFYTISKSYDQSQHFDEAFEFATLGAAIHKDEYTYDEEDLVKLYKSIKNSFTKEQISSFSTAGCPDDTPVFVLGMPRSGTTLIDQIICSHPEAGSVGETDELRNLWNEFFNQAPSQTMAQAISSTMPDVYANVGCKFINILRSLDSNHKKVVEKTPSNFQRIGFIFLTMPNSKIIHCMRNPIDVCVSNYLHSFVGNAQPWSYDLLELGRFYKMYIDMMDFWRSIGSDRILDVQYEATVADQEGQSRRIMEFIGLPWSEQVMEFHKTERPVLTSSIGQVNQPIYTDSVARWRRYEKHLGPLFDALGPDLLRRFGVSI